MLRFRLLIIISIAIIHLWFIPGCISSGDDADLKGEWLAEWSMKPSDLTIDIPPENLVMSGIFEFSKNNMATVTAFGYPGCLFCSDTLTNMLSWEIIDQNLKMHNPEYDFTLEYFIEEKTGDFMRLRLMDDIEVQLTKK